MVPSLRMFKNPKNRSKSEIGCKNEDGSETQNYSETNHVFESEDVFNPKIHVLIIGQR